MPFDILASVIYGTELVMWIGIMICGVVLGRGEKEEPSPETEVGDEQEQGMEMPRVESSGVRAASITSRISGQIFRALFYLVCSAADTSRYLVNTVEVVSSFRLLHCFTPV